MSNYYDDNDDEDQFGWAMAATPDPRDAENSRLRQALNEVSEEADEVIRHIRASYQIIPDSPLANKLASLNTALDKAEKLLSGAPHDQ